jgi:hypothetical protein
MTRRSFLLALAAGAAAPRAADASCILDRLAANVPAGAHPRVETFRDPVPEDVAGCLETEGRPVRLAIVLAGRFDGGSLDDLASRIGAVSRTVGLPYWSTTRQVWRPLVSNAHAVTDAVERIRRRDFSAAEFRPGNGLFFVQNDTESTGDNLHEMTVRAKGPDSLTVEIVNISPIRLAFVTLFEARSLLAVHRIARVRDGGWTYSGVSALKNSVPDGAEKSLINRAGAFYRYIAGIAPDTEPPLAP